MPDESGLGGSSCDMSTTLTNVASTSAAATAAASRLSSTNEESCSEEPWSTTKRLCVSAASVWSDDGANTRSVGASKPDSESGIE